MAQVQVDTASLIGLVGELFAALGATKADARLLADSLVTADLEGVASHGVMLLPMYVQRVRAGSVSLSAMPTIVEDHGGLVIMTAANALGQVSSQKAVDIAVARARVHGVSVVSVRDGFHFGAAAYWTRQFAQAGMIGFALSNTRPLMPAPGGAERIVGNNPLSVAFPGEADAPLVVDMATSASAMGKIRVAASQGQPIPQGWATDADGRPTTVPQAAIEGMLLPAAGPKGFGLAIAIDLLCGALSGGGVGAAVRPLYAQLDQPYNCSHTFIAIDASKVDGGQGIEGTVGAFVRRVRNSRLAPGHDRAYAPGDLERARRQACGTACPLPAGLPEQLDALAQGAGIAHRIQAI
jgi:LDH2 family malate/lactate/ureidoglycolate dehydrogenase